MQLLPARGTALEIAAGTGVHAVHFAGLLPGWRWLPSDPSTEARDSIAAWVAQAGLANLQPPLALDVLQPDWALPAPVEAIFCANMLHIAPWSCCGALMQGAARWLAPGGLLITYGPCLVQGEATAESNLAFDRDLRARNPLWGLRWLHDIQASAADHGLALQQRLYMPANNQLLVFKRHAAP